MCVEDIEKNEKEMDEREKEIANKKKWSLEDDEDDDEMEEDEKEAAEKAKDATEGIAEKEADGDVKMKEPEFDPLEAFMAAEILPKMEEDVKKALFLEEKEEQNAIKDGRIEDARSVQVPDSKADKKKEVDPYDSDASDLWFLEEEEEEDDEVSSVTVDFMSWCDCRSGLGDYRLEG